MWTVGSGTLVSEVVALIEMFHTFAARHAIESLAPGGLEGEEHGIVALLQVLGERRVDGGYPSVAAVVVQLALSWVGEDGRFILLAPFLDFLTGEACTVFLPVSPHKYGR